MLNHPTLDKLLALRLTGMAKALSEQMDLPESQTLSFEERLGLLVDREMTVRSDRRLTTRLRQAKLRLSAIDLQKMNWKFRAGVHEHPGVCLKRHCGHHCPGGYTREYQNTAQCCDGQSFTRQVATGLSQR